MTRRQFIQTLVTSLGAIGILVASPSSAWACLVGKWRVRCPNGHVDDVDQITCNHTCEKCGAQAFKDGEGDIVCPNNHGNHVKTGNRDQRGMWIESFACTTCGAQCSLTQAKSKEPHAYNDRP